MKKDDHGQKIPDETKCQDDEHWGAVVGVWSVSQVLWHDVGSKNSLFSSFVVRSSDNVDKALLERKQFEIIIKFKSVIIYMIK